MELGTHWGGSLFSMAQPIKDFKLLTKIYGVDTWRGDKQAGFYSEGVFAVVKKIKTTIYKNLNITLVRKFFDEAVNDFKNKSINLLHIDGLHTYEAVKHDFDTWLPKVKKDGIIIFHDVLEKKDDFGVYKLWDELKIKYKYFEFINFHGLGLIFIGKQFFNFDKVYQNYYPLLHEINKFDKDIKSKDEDIKSKDEDIKSKDEDIKSKEILIEKYGNELANIDESMSRFFDLQKEILKLHRERSDYQLQLNNITSSGFYKFWQ
ncbi:class I SAM-dependent methyltransferase, partial [Patescibacteria group bacterium]|nr:class I SAM-dependent methyltransferase [Patescibacteria group bacterium]